MRPFRAEMRKRPHGVLSRVPRGNAGGEGDILTFVGFFIFSVLFPKIRISCCFLPLFFSLFFKDFLGLKFGCVIIRPMAAKIIRVYQKLDFAHIQAHVLIYGELSGSCGGCNALDLKLDAAHCPSCQREFQYISFRNPSAHLPKILRLMEERPQLRIVDFEDYRRIMGALKAEEFLKD